MDDQYNICKGNVTTSSFSESLEVMTDIHIYVDGLVHITYGKPIRFEKGGWFDSNNCNCIVGYDKGATIGHVCRISSQFFILAKGLRNNSLRLISKKVVNITMHFIIEFTLNPSFHIYSLCVSLLRALETSGR